MFPQTALNMFIPRVLENTTSNFVPAKLTLELDINGMHSALSGFIDPDSGITLTNYKEIIKRPALRKLYVEAMCKELGRLSQGYGETMGTNCVKWMAPEDIPEIPQDLTKTHAKIVYDYRKQKADQNRVRITAGGNLIDYPHELTTRTSDLITTKLLWESVISTPGARYVCIDIKNMYLMTRMERRKYVKISADIIPEKFIQMHNLQNKIYRGHLYMEIQRGMY